LTNLARFGFIDAVRRLQHLQQIIADAGLGSLAAGPRPNGAHQQLCGAGMSPHSKMPALPQERHITASATEELKIGEFQPEHIGKMQFYLAVLDDTARLDAENPSIGILICKSKDRNHCRVRVTRIF
jgi:hypothetical protein